MKYTRRRTKILAAIFSASLLLGSVYAQANEGFSFEVSGTKIEGNVGSVWDYMAKIDVNSFTESEFREFREKFISETVRLGGTIEVGKSNLEFSCHRIDRPELIKHFFPEKLEVIRASQVDAEVTEQRKAVVRQADAILESLKELKVETYTAGQQGIKAAALEVVAEARNAMTELQRVITADLGFKVGEVNGLLGTTRTDLVINEFSDVERDIRRVYNGMSYQFDKLDVIESTALGKNPTLEGLKVGDYVQLAYEKDGRLMYREGVVESISRGATAEANGYTIKSDSVVSYAKQGSIKVYNVIGNPTIWATKMGLNDVLLSEYMNRSGFSFSTPQELLRATRQFFFNPSYAEARRSERAYKSNGKYYQIMDLELPKQERRGLWERVMSNFRGANTAGSNVDIKSAVRRGKK